MSLPRSQSPCRRLPSFATHTGPGQGYAVGTFTVVTDANGEIVVPLSGRGTIIDVCEVLD